MDEQFDLATTEGVQRFLQQIHRINAERRKGNVDCALMFVTFMDAYKNAGLTQREVDVIYGLYEQQMSQREVAKTLGLSRQRIGQLAALAIEKVAARGSAKGSEK